ncbi:hypothetical protein RI570_04215 [Brucella pseudogrignonensis]|uniref:hypothetical protein n=1 Tax=Brucella pseudogrignonensis TaxID=419475 RepID=UPI0028B96B82|nr:hypothetical protein [Brucella pseudogrignonensis]MDT6939348.1 hypothetical protein [Brucella pseudogrignonensis]
MFVELSELATVGLGFKSLQNTFFYVNHATIDTYGIEDRFLAPILMLKSLDSGAFLQDPVNNQWVFLCREKQEDIRNTGALKYIQAMGDRPAIKKKQAGKSQTIMEALQNQGGKLWYAPKARPHLYHVALRKAVNGNFSPYLFEKPALLDQRLNGLQPNGINWKELAAVLTSTLFSYSLEVNGSTNMGAGALEAPTSQLRRYPVFDVRALDPQLRAHLVSLAEAVWTGEKPVDWLNRKSHPGTALQQLDNFLLSCAGGAVSTKKLYDDLREVCAARSTVAKDKDKKVKKKKDDSIGTVAKSIAKAVSTKISLKNFPEDFSDVQDMELFLSFEKKSLKTISLTQFMDQIDVKVVMKNGAVIYEKNHSRSVAEAITRAILWGRSSFSISPQPRTMEQAISKFIDWASGIDTEIEKLVTDSAVGTGYEEALKKEVYKQLGVHQLAAAKFLPSEISLDF